MDRTAVAVPLLLFLVSGMAGAEAGNCLAVWVETRGQPAECSALDIQKELGRQPDVCVARNPRKAAVRLKLLSCREQVAAAIPPPGSTVAGREYLVRAQVSEGELTKELSGLDHDSWREAVRSLCRSIVLWHGSLGPSR